MKKEIRKVVLEDGSVFTGTGFGAMEERKAEIVFNTSMVGYQEIFSDPSYTGQAVVMTYPLIGNYGMCEEDYETLHPSIFAMIVREYCDHPSNFRCTKTLSEMMEKYHVCGVEGIDTRKLARHIRDIGSCKACIVSGDVSDEEAVEALKNWEPETDQVKRVSVTSAFEFDPGPEEHSCYHVVAIDCGIKTNILRELRKRQIKVTVVPWNTTAEEILSYAPDGVFLSNGPGNPVDVPETIQTIRSLIGKLPIFGICLGHQIISLAYGASTYKLKFGHRGGNHPVRNLETGKLEITSQNHSYAVENESISGTRLKVSHINLLDQTIEGVICEEDRVFSVQYHPESAPGPQDSTYLFDRFIRYMSMSKEA